MRSSGWALTQYPWGPDKKGTLGRRHVQREGAGRPRGTRVQAVPERLQAQECRRPRMEEGGLQLSPPHGLRGRQPCRHLGLGLLAPRRRDHVFLLFKWDCITAAQETNARRRLGVEISCLGERTGPRATAVTAKPGKGGSDLT